MRTNRRDDYEKNLVMNNFLDKKLYGDSIFENVIRECGKERQLAGVDVEFDLNGEHYICDEKATTDDNYINRNIPLNTFCLELSSIQGNVEREGWLLRDENINNSYLFVWIDNADNCDIRKCGIEGISKCEICLVKKDKILAYLNGLGWTKERLRRKCHNIRYENDRKFGNHKENGCKFSYSQYNKGETPINVLLTREVYRNLCDYNKVYVR